MQKKQENGIISTNQYVWLLFTIITSFSTLQIVGRLIAHAGRDAWLSVVIAWFLDVLLAVVYAYMGVRFPGENMVQYSITILGKIGGRIVASIFLVFFLLCTSALIRSLCTLLIGEFFPRTPINVFLVICFILIGVGAKKGLEAIARTSEILGPIYLLCFIVILAMAARLVNIDNLKPQLYEGWFPPLTGAPFLLSFISICIIMGMFIPYCNKPENGLKGKFISVTLGSAVAGLLVVFGIGIFGSVQAGNLVNVGLKIARIVEVGNAIQRLEAIWLMVSVAAGIMASISLIWAFSLGVSQVVGLKGYKHLVYPAVLLSFVLTITSFENSNDINDFSNYIFPFIAIFVESVLECFLLIMALVLKKKGKAA